MPLNAATLATEIEAEIKSKMVIPAFGEDNLQKLCQAIASAVVTHIQTNALVSTTGTAAAQTGTVS